MDISDYVSPPSSSLSQCPSFFAKDVQSSLGGAEEMNIGDDASPASSSLSDCPGFSASAVQLAMARAEEMNMSDYVSPATSSLSDCTGFSDNAIQSALSRTEKAHICENVSPASSVLTGIQRNIAAYDPPLPSELLRKGFNEDSQVWNANSPVSSHAQREYDITHQGSCNHQPIVSIEQEGNNNENSQHNESDLDEEEFSDFADSENEQENETHCDNGVADESAIDDETTSSDCKLNESRFIVKMNYFFDQMKKLIRGHIHRPNTCENILDFDITKVHRSGFHTRFTITCMRCNKSFIIDSEPKTSDYLDINSCAVVGASAVGQG